MTSLEKFLLKRSTGKASEEKKSEEHSTPKATNELKSAISQLQSIFPTDSEESLMLLALQYQDPKELESVVQRILDDTSTLDSYTKSWNTVKSRDKKKAEQKKKNKNKRNFKEEEPEGGEYSRPYRGNYANQRGYNKRGGYYEQRKPRDAYEERPRYYEEKPSAISKNEEIANSIKQILNAPLKSPQEPEERDLVVEESKVERIDHATDFPKLSEPSDSKEGQDFWKSIDSNYDTQIPPQEIHETKYISKAPPLVISNESLAENVIPREVTEKVLDSPRVVKPAEKNPVRAVLAKQDFGVQVDLDYGIPIIVYPYMFQRK